MLKPGAIKLFLIILLVIPVNAMSQPDTVSAPEKTDRHAFYTGAGYGSNMIWLGSTISQNQPFQYGAVAYSLFEKLTFSGSAFYLPNLAPSAPAFYSASIYFNHDITSWLDISAGAYSYMVRPILTDTLFGNFNYADINLGIDWKILYTEINYGAFVMKEPPTYFQVKNSRYFETPSFFRKKANFSFFPYVNLLFGNLITEYTYNGTEIITTTQTLVTPVTTTTSTGQGSGSGTGQGSGSGNGSTQGQGADRHPEPGPPPQQPLPQPLPQPQRPRYPPPPQPGLKNST